MSTLRLPRLPRDLHQTARQSPRAATRVPTLRTTHHHLRTASARMIAHRAKCLPVEQTRKTARRRSNLSGFTRAPRRYMADGLPPCPDPIRLALELKLVPERDREDAMQVAWLASVEGRCPARAVNTWWRRELRRRRREFVRPDVRYVIDGDNAAGDRRGS